MTFNAHDWVEGDKLYVSAKSPSQVESTIFFNSYSNFGPPVNTWETIDLSNKVPENAVAINLTGILIITHGTTPETADLRIYFRTDPTYDVINYTHQCIEADTTAGQRCTMSVWVALDENKQFQYKWEVPQLGTWPNKSAYGASLRLNAILTNEKFNDN